MAIQFMAHNLIPGDHDLVQTQEQQVWFGDRSQQVFGHGVLASTLTDAGNTPTSLIRPGLLLGLNSDGELVPWDPDAVAATGAAVPNYIAGIYLGQMEMNYYGTATKRYDMVLTGGRVYADRIIIPGNSSAGIAGDDYEFLVREQLDKRFLVSDDMLVGGHTVPKFANITSGTAYTATKAMHNTHFHVEDGAGAITITLPDAVPGLTYKFSASNDDNVTITDTTGTAGFLDDTGDADDVVIIGGNSETVTLVGVIDDGAGASAGFKYSVQDTPATS